MHDANLPSTARPTCRQLSNLNIQATLPLQLRQLGELQELKLDGNRRGGAVCACCGVQAALLPR